MPMVGGARAGVGGVRLADGSSDGGGGGGGQCGCFATSPLIHTTEGGAGLDTVDVSGLATDEEWVYWVESVQAPFLLDRTALAAGLTINHTTVEAVLGEANSRWVRLQWQNPTWQAQLHWAIDHDNGDDENLGCGTTDAAALTVPLATTAEWRRRIDGARFTATVQVNVRRSNVTTVDDDDGLFVGFTTPIDSTIRVDVVGLAVVLTNGTGSLSAVQTRTGNLKQTITDAGQTWAANGLISSTTGNRMVRKTGGAWHAFVVQAVSTTSVMITRPTNCSETPSATPGNTQVNPAVADTYEVCSLTPWPEIRTAPGGRVRKYLLDTLASTTPSATNGRIQAFDIVIAALCAWRIAFSTNQQDSVTLATCNFASTASFREASTAQSCGFMNTLVFQNGGAMNWQTLENLLVGVNGVIQVRHGSTVDCCGILVMHDQVGSTLLFVDFGGRISLQQGSIVGSGSTGLVLLAADGQISGGANATVGTTSVAPYSLNGIASNTLPMVDEVAGGAIYL